MSSKYLSPDEVKARNRECAKKYRLKNPDRIRKRKREYNLKNKDRIRVAGKKWRLNNKEKIKAWQTKYKTKMDDAVRRYRAKNKARIAARRTEIYHSIPKHIRSIKIKEKNDRTIQYKKKWYIENRESMLAKNKIYYSQNKDQSLSKYGRRRARMKGSKSVGENPEIIKSFYAISRRVSKCLGIKHHVDHIIPIAKGGPHHQGNLQVIPWRINFRKGSRIIKP